MEDAIVQDENTSEQQVESEAPEEEAMVPRSVFEEEQKGRKQAEEHLAEMRGFAQAALQQRQQQQPPTAQNNAPDLDDADVLTVGEFKKSASELVTSLSTRINELEMCAKYPGYTDAVTNYLPEVLKENPALLRDLQESPNLERAYFLASNSKSYLKDKASNKVHADAKKIVENAEKSGSLSGVGRSSTTAAGSRYNTMTDAEFLREANKNLF